MNFLIRILSHGAAVCRSVPCVPTGLRIVTAIGDGIFRYHSPFQMALAPDG